MAKLKLDAETLRGLMTLGVRGSIGKQFVIRRTQHGAILARYPRKSTRHPTAAQTRQREKFKEAIAHARHVVSDLVLYERYKEDLKPGETVYAKAIQEFLRGKHLPPKKWWMW